MVSPPPRSLVAGLRTVGSFGPEWPKARGGDTIEKAVVVGQPCLLSTTWTHYEVWWLIQSTPIVLSGLRWGGAQPTASSANLRFPTRRRPPSPPSSRSLTSRRCCPPSPLASNLRCWLAPCRQALPVSVLRSEQSPPFREPDLDARHVPVQLEYARGGTGTGCRTTLHTNPCHAIR